MNLRQEIYFTLVALRGQPLGKYYRQIYNETKRGIAPDITKKLLVEMLDHCNNAFLYYRQHHSGKG